MEKHELDFTVLDVETSGLEPQNDQIIEFCMIRVRAGEPVLVFNSLVNFKKELNPKITEITGHTIEDLAGGIEEDQLAFALHSLIEPDEVLVAYNAAFDLEFLEVLIAGHVDANFKLLNPFVDPLTIARDRFPYPHKLVDTAKRFGITFEAHSAYEDTFALLDTFVALDKQSDVSKYLNVLGYKTKYGKPTWAPPHAVLKPQDGSKNNNSKTGVSVPKQRASRTAATPKNTPTKTTPKAPIEPVVMKNPARQKFTQDVSDNTMPTGLTFDKLTLERVNSFLEGSSIKVSVSTHDAPAVTEFIESRTERDIFKEKSGNLTTISWADSDEPPTGDYVSEVTRQQVDEFAKRERNEITVGQHEFDLVMVGLRSHGVSEDDIYSSLDADDVVIEWKTLRAEDDDPNSKPGHFNATALNLRADEDPFASYDPFARTGKPIEISDDDLPF